MASINEKELPKAIDLSHHLSELSKSRMPSPLKGLARYWGRPGLISLAGGMPAPDYFPLSVLSADTLVKDSFALTPTEKSSSPVSWFWKLFGAGAAGKERTEHISVPKYASSPDDINLAIALQYGTAQGLVPLQKFMKEFSTKVYQPAYGNFATLVHAGNTDGWFKVVSTLCNRGEQFLVEEWTYPSAMATARPLGLSPAPIKIDGEGMRSDDLRKVLSEWDEEERGAKRPHVMYTVPVGQNPTGATMGGTRKKEIYDICVEFDVIIVEDDPYYFLQFGKYMPKTERVYNTSHATGDVDEEAAYVASLAPSYLKFDYQGRVIRLDTFSKTVAPGSRLGWFTCNEVFAERLERQGESSTQAPCGFGQAIITQLLTKQWGYAGYVRWLRGLGTEYTMRRDFFVDCLYEEFHMTRTVATQGAWAGSTAYIARPKPGDVKALTGTTLADEKHAFGENPLFSLVPPSSGMFVWLKVEFENHPSFTSPEDRAELEIKLWSALAEANVLVGPGWIFAAEDEVQKDAEGHLRIAFSGNSFDDMKQATKIMRKVFVEFFRPT